MKSKLWVLILTLLCVHTTLQVQAQDEESEYKDTPWFSGMPNYMIYSAEDIEFDSYNFFNGKNCSTIEGRKFKRAYSLKEDATNQA